MIHWIQTTIHCVHHQLLIQEICPVVRPGQTILALLNRIGNCMKLKKNNYKL